MLTRSEQSIIDLAGRGPSTAEIARQLHLSPATVRTYLVRLYRKLGLRSLAQLALYAHGLYPAKKSGNPAMR